MVFCAKSVISFSIFVYFNTTSMNTIKWKVYACISQTMTHRRGFVSIKKPENTGLNTSSSALFSTQQRWEGDLDTVCLMQVANFGTLFVIIRIAIENLLNKRWLNAIWCWKNMKQMQIFILWWWNDPAKMHWWYSAP